MSESPSNEASQPQPATSQSVSAEQCSAGTTTTPTNTDVVAGPPALVGAAAPASGAALTTGAAAASGAALASGAAPADAASKGEAAKREVRHALEVALANPLGFLKVVVGVTGSILALLLLAAFLIAEFLICNDIIIPGVYSVAAKTNQVVVPAAAGWVAVNPEVPFPKGAKIRFKVSGRVHLGIHEVVDLAKFRGPLTAEPPTILDPTKPDCSAATTYLRSLGEWRHPWRDVRSPGETKPDACRLSPKQAGGKLVFAVLENPPRDEQLGVNILASATVKDKGILDSDTQITLKDAGYVILAVNDRLDCDSTYAEKRDKLRNYLQGVATCQVTSGKQLPALYDLSDEFLRGATIADNQGEFFVHLSVE